jgi:hypothetical protein
MVNLDVISVSHFECHIRALAFHSFDYNRWRLFQETKLYIYVLRSSPWLGWPLWNICVTNYHGYVPLVVNTSRSFPRSWLIIRFVTRLTRRVSLVEQELPTLPEHLSSPPVFSGVCITRSLVLYRCLSFCTFSFEHCVVCSSSIYGFGLPLWYLQTLLIPNTCTILIAVKSLCPCCIS